MKLIDKLLGRMSWLLWLSVLLCAMFPLAALGAKWQLWTYNSAFSLLAGLTMTAAVILALLGVGLVVSISKGNRSAKHAATAALLILILPISYVFSHLYRAQSLPAIHDVSTDLSNPPSFIVAQQLREQNPQPGMHSTHWNPEIEQLQQAGYSDIAPIYLPLPLEKVAGLVTDSITKLPWTLTHVATDKAQFEATATSFWFGFVDDIVIRLTPEGKSTRVDMRSASRVGRSDLGKNAQRIRFFRQALLKANNKS